MKKIILLIFILFYSCVEHKIFFVVSPKGFYTAKYKAHGDKQDLIDFDFTIPNSSDWEVYSNLDNDDVESCDIIANKIFLIDEGFPETFYTGDSLYFESLLKHPINFNYTNFLFWETYSFNGKFEGRNVKSKYSLVNDLISDVENPPNGWMPQVLEYLFLETLNQSNIDWNMRPIIASEIKNWINQDLSVIPDSMIYDDIDYYKNLGLDIIMQPIPPTLYDDIDSIYKVLEDQFKITIDLIDDSFDLNLKLPGELQFNNANTIIGDTLRWSFQIEDFMDGDYIFHASSKINHPNRQIMGIILFFLILFFMNFKKKKIFN